jgi:hypothetical protein
MMFFKLTHPNSSQSHSNRPREWYSGALFYTSEEDDVRKAIILTIAALAFLAGCGNQNKNSGIPLRPRFQGPPYQIAFDTPPAKPNKAGITIPAIKYTPKPDAPPDALEKRATLVVRIDTSSLAKKQPQMMDQIIMGPVDITGAGGALPPDYMDAADTSLATLLEEYCIRGKVKISVVLTRSSLSSTAGDAEIESKRLSDWLPIELVFKNPLRGC